ncbi:MAG: zinc-ribbon domain-containing protein [Thermodesulfobacteriota bacterium]
MEVICEQCKTKLNIPDEKLPKDQVVKIGCPKCKNRITLDTRTASSDTSAAPGQENLEGTGKFHLKFIEPKREKEPEQGYGYSDYSDDKALEFFEEGTKLALVMGHDQEQALKIKSAVEELGYKGIVSPNTRDAVGKMRFHHFDVVMLSDGFDAQPLENSPILNHMNRLPISVRRRVFLGLMGENFKSMDNMMAFAMSANAVVNSKDIDKLGSMLRRAISDSEKFYKVFMDTLAQMGKA